MNIWDVDKLILFLFFVIPGFISIKTFSLFVPDVHKDSSKQMIDAIAYSSINYSLLLPAILAVEKSNLSETHFNCYLLFYFFILFLSPILISIVWLNIRTSKYLSRFSPHPIGKPWDYVFSQQNKSYLVKVTLKDNTVVGGLYSNKSFASSSPNPEQIYLEESWKICDDGSFTGPKNDTAGVIILTNEISFIELRKVKYEQ